MNTPQDGGPAFPETRWDDIHRRDVQWSGMSLRAWFAGQALAGPAMGMAMLDSDGEYVSAESIAETAFLLADAMLAEAAYRGPRRTQKGG